MCSFAAGIRGGTIVSLADQSISIPPGDLQEQAVNCKRAIAYLLVFIAGAATLFAAEKAFFRNATESLQNRTGQDRERSVDPGDRQQDSIASGTGIRPPDDGVADSQASDSLMVPEPEARLIVGKSEAVEETRTTTQSPVQTSSEAEELRFEGVTEPAPGRFARLPLATAEPVAFVDVRMGDRVKKGWQVFSHWESPERLQAVRSDLERMRKQLEVAKARHVAAEQTKKRLEGLGENIPAQELEDARLLLDVRFKEMENAEFAVAAAESSMIAMEFEFNQAFVTSPIEGVVASVDVHQGERRQITGAFRGVTVIDTRVLNFRCLLDQEQLAKFESLVASARNETPDSPREPDAKQPADVVPADGLHAIVESGGKEWKAKLLAIGVLADPQTGRIPVLFEIENPDESLRAGIPAEILIRRQALSGSHQAGN